MVTRCDLSCILVMSGRSALPTRTVNLCAGVRTSFRGWFGRVCWFVSWASSGSLKVRAPFELARLCFSMLCLVTVLGSAVVRTGNGLATLCRLSVDISAAVMLRLVKDTWVGVTATGLSWR